MKSLSLSSISPLRQTSDGYLYGYNDVAISGLGNRPGNVSDVVQMGGGVHNEALVSAVCGKYYALTRAGRVFIHTSVVAGVAYPISTTLTPLFGIWNPADSGRAVVPLLYSTAYVSGTAVQTAIDLAVVLNTGSALATAAPISAITSVTPRNALVGGGAVSKALGFSTATLTTAGVLLHTLGLNNFTGAATVPVTVAPRAWYDFEGALILPPGNMIYTMGNAASGSLHVQVLIAAELEA